MRGEIITSPSHIVSSNISVYSPSRLRMRSHDVHVSGVLVRGEQVDVRGLALARLHDAVLGEDARDRRRVHHRLRLENVRRVLEPRERV
jgi:hypothetical protein